MTSHHLVSETGALAGYTQSDEISLLFYSDDPKSQIYFDGRVQKMASVLAAMATAFFNHTKRLSKKAETLALFDCRVWQVPTKDESANTFLWRELDATKNSISMAASALYSHNALIGKNSNLQIERSEVAAIEMPPFSRVSNRVAVLFDGQPPVHETAHDPARREGV